MSSNIMIIYTLLICVTFLSQLIYSQRACLSPMSLCVPFHDCLYLEQQYAQFPQRVPAEFIDYLYRSKCDGPTTTPHFCCDASMVKGAITASPLITTPKYNQNGLEILNSQKCGPMDIYRISHGIETDLAEFPWMALLIYNNKETPFKCGGSLITDRYVLTSAHCMVGIYNNLIGVRLGEHNISTISDCEKRGFIEFCSPPAEDYGVEEQIPHPEYDEYNFLNDIGLIRLNRTVVFKNHIQPICLPIFPDSTTPLNNEYIIAGWGLSEIQNISSVLLRAKVQQRNRQYCQKIFKRRLTENHICAGGDGISSSCHGDSGGPLFYLAEYKGRTRFVQFGIISCGIFMCGGDKTLPSVYANILDLLPWITHNIS